MSTRPNHIQEKINGITSQWKQGNDKVPCTIFEATEKSLVERIVSMVHGKGEKAGRDQWNAVARARHNRDVNSVKETGLDLLEKYIKVGKNINSDQRERWAGDYPLSVLDEVLRKYHSDFGGKSSKELAINYPKVIKRDFLEVVISEIGLKIIGFNIVRDEKEFFERYAVISGRLASGLGSTTSGLPASQNPTLGTDNPTSGAKSTKPVAVAINDPIAVSRTLKAFKPVGKNRGKVVTLRDEAVKLKLKGNPLAFCFILRSMFEISAKAYCDDHATTSNLTAVKADGSDRSLVDVLRDVTAHLISNGIEKSMKKRLHGAMTEIAKPDGILSVTSMNQLVHNPSFSIISSDICVLFGNIFPLLEEMNK